MAIYLTKNFNHLLIILLLLRSGLRLLPIVLLVVAAILLLLAPPLCAVASAALNTNLLKYKTCYKEYTKLHTLTPTSLYINQKGSSGKNHHLITLIFLD